MESFRPGNTFIVTVSYDPKSFLYKIVANDQTFEQEIAPTANFQIKDVSVSGEGVINFVGFIFNGNSRETGNVFNVLKLVIYQT